jgi:tRNA nucleotidyltransferase (CCA-adding enzyme)
MEIYLVGGAVRDKLLGLPVNEKDWVAVGATPKQLLGLGFKPVGKDFPVFLHPETKEEYALARTEKKSAPGYAGFVFHAAPDVSLLDDLKRRDLTINAIAQSQETGELFDPYHGQEDIERRMLRHVSPAFVEDPVRVLRIARFAARFSEFTIAEETNQLMQAMVENGEVNALIEERVWKELHKALSEKTPRRFFDSLQACGALQAIFPELANDVAVLDVMQHVHAPTPLLLFAAIAAQLTSPQAFCQRLRCPKPYMALACLSEKLVTSYQQHGLHTPEQAIDFLQLTDAFRRPQRFEQALEVVTAILQHKHQQDFCSVADSLKQALLACQKLDVQALVNDHQGKAIAEAIRVARISVVLDLALFS